MSRFIPAPSVSDWNVVHLAIGLANTVTSLDAFYNRIASKKEPFDPRFTSDGATPSIIAEILRKSPVTITVHIGKPKNRFSRALGWTYPGDPQNVYLNVRRLDRAPDDIARTLVHEWVHATDDIHPLNFHHGNNNWKGKGNTAPYWIDELAGQFLAKLVEGVGLSPSGVETPLHLDDGDFVEPDREEEES
jgi:hypothetical protein